MPKNIMLPSIVNCKNRTRAKIMRMLQKKKQENERFGDKSFLTFIVLSELKETANGQLQYIRRSSLTTAEKCAPQKCFHQKISST